MTEIPEKPWFPLETDRLILREFRESDFDDVHTYGSDPAVARFMVWGPNTLEVSQTFLGLLIEGQKTWPRKDVSLALELRETGKLIGSIRLWVVQEDWGTAEIGYSLDRGHWRRGFAFEAASAMMRAGFEVLKLHRVVATCDVRNRGSWGVMRKLGMRREGKLMQDRLIKGHWRDTYSYAILANEWRARSKQYYPDIIDSKHGGT